MAKSTAFLLIIFLLTGCTQTTNPLIENDSRESVLSESDKADLSRNEATENLDKAGCSLTNPDTSVYGIKIRDAESADAVIGNNNQIDGNEQYHFYSKLEREMLTLTQHPGDAKNQISIFNVQYSDKADYGYRQLPVDTFTSENGIKLGTTKAQVINRLGDCYAVTDSTKRGIKIYYRIESPKDSKTKLLQRNNMPVYYASYKFWDDLLQEYEFGFEYP